jgi:hypothetical protein
VAFYIIGLPLSLLLGFKLGFHTKVQKKCFSKLASISGMFVLLKPMLQTVVYLTDNVQITYFRGCGWVRYVVSFARTPFYYSSHYEQSGKEWS